MLPVNFMRIREFNAEIRHGNCLIISCQGTDNQGNRPHCCGMIRIPFRPTLNGVPEANSEGNKYWKRSEGETVDDITFAQSINAGGCGHFNITKGELIIHEQDKSEK